MQCGTAVICSNTTSLPEVVGDAGILVSPTDGEAVSHAMLEMYSNNSRRINLEKKSLIRACQFSCEKFTNQTWELYQKIS